MNPQLAPQPIKIIAEPVIGSPNVCKFIVERPLVELGSFRFCSIEESQGSRLAEEIFALGSIAEITIARNLVLITKRGYGTWRDIGSAIGSAIRTAIQSDSPLVAAEKIALLPQSQVVKEKVEALIISDINPMVAGHGGFIELVNVEANDIYIKMGGGCQGCAASKATLKQGVESTLRKHLPELGFVHDATDHAQGANPYFK